ncbi:hypothetical protein HMPREF9156_01211 [Scardovia wiggsiae F0424]|uniref:Uncharacterized protein n=2 Tax=Scardovia wiggsiae TaxID=230143 RepID=J0X025_9BIFI|nr:hypothetical protein HMPREF9156_01211 [Scardovia wiggsiae F0424]
MKRIISHNIERLKALIINHINISFFIIVFLFTIVLYNVYTQPGSHRFLADNSVTLLTYLVGLTALIAFTVTFFNSFASTNVKNAYYLGINRNLFRLSKKPGYSLISSKEFRGSLLLLYIIPLSKYFIPKDKLVLLPHKPQFSSIDINSLLLSFWYVTYLFCLFSLILSANDCLSLLWSRSDMLQSERDKTDNMIDDSYKKEFCETLIHYIENYKNNEDPIELIEKRINLFQEDEKFIYLYTILNDSEKKVTYRTLFMNNDEQKTVFRNDNSSIISDRILCIKRYFENKWKVLSTLKIEDRSQELLEFIDGQYKRNTELCLNIYASWGKEYSEKVLVPYPKEDPNPKQQIDTLLSKMTQCYNKAYLHNADADPKKIIELHETLKKAIDIGKNGNIQTATQGAEKVLQETQKAIESDYLETAGEFLLTYPWQARGWQVWKVKENYIKLTYNKDGTELLHLLNEQNITDLVLLKAILEFLPIEQIIRHLIYTCAYSHRRYDVSPIVVKYELYKSIIQRKTMELDKLKKPSDFQTSLIGSISKDIDYYDIGYYLNDHIVKIIIDSIFSDGKIDQQLIDKIRGVFDTINYLALRSCLTSEYKVLSKISPDIAESPQKEDLRDSIKSTQKNYPETIPSVMARLSEILQK